MVIRISTNFKWQNSGGEGGGLQMLQSGGFSVKGVNVLEGG